MQTQVKTETMLFTRTDFGWTAAHKKFNHFLGTVRVAVRGEEAEVFLEDFCEETRAEAERFAARAVFLAYEVERARIGEKTLLREDFEAAEAARRRALHRTSADYADVLGKPVHVVMDRPLGSAHPRHPEMVYPVNYGAVPGLLAGDGAEQDVYVLGPTKPLETFDGVVIAVIHRFDDVEDKWVAAAAPGLYTAGEILDAVHFQEQYYESELLM